MRSKLIQLLFYFLLLLINLHRSIAFAGNGSEKRVQESLIGKVNALEEPDVVFTGLNDMDQSKRQCSSDIRKSNLERKMDAYCSIPGPRDWGKTCRKIIVELGTETFVLGATLYTTACLMNRSGSAASTATGLAPQTTQNVLMMASGAITSTIGSAIRSTASSIRHCRLTFEEGILKLHQELVKESEQELKTLPPDLQRQIRSIDYQIRTKIVNKQTTDAINLIRQREQAYFALPTHSLNIGFPGLYQEDQMALKVEALILKQPEKNREHLRDFVDKIRESSDSKEGLKPQALLFGPRGTGKTVFVRDLAATLGLSLCEISLAGIDSNDLLGKKFPWEPEKQTVGKIAECFIKAGNLNPIIFFDEATSSYLGDAKIPSAGSQRAGNYAEESKRVQLLGEFKKILDPHLTHLQVPGLGDTKLNIAKAVWIFAGNFKMDPDLEKGGRITLFHFDKLDREQKHTALLDALNWRLTELSLKISPPDQAHIRVLVTNYVDRILDEDEARRIPGARNLQAVTKDLVTHIRGRLRRGEAILNEEIHAYLLSAFDRYPADPEDEIRRAD